MTLPKWTKTYELRANRRTLRVQVSEHSNGFYASCLWFADKRLLKAPDQPGSNPVQSEIVFETTEDAVLSKIVEWAETKFGEPFELAEL